MYALKEAVAGVRRSPLLGILSAAMVALALFVVGLFAVVSYNLRQALERIEERVEVVAFVRDDVRPAEIEAAVSIFRDLPEVAEVRFVSKEDALRLAQEELEEFHEVFAGLAANPLPASLEVKMRPGFRTPEAVERVAGIAAELPFVEDVRFGEEWVDTLHTLRRIGGVATTVLGIAFAAVAALIIGTAIRIAIFAKREEILIMRLVGATSGFIRRPFLLEGFLTGIVGGVVALGLTWLAYRTAAELLPFFSGIAWIPGAWVATGVLAGAFFGVAASAFAVSRYLREV